MTEGTPRIRDRVKEVDEKTEEGRRKIEWARDHMPILESLREEFRVEQPFSGSTIGMAMHVEAKTAVLVEALAVGGATVLITGCNPLSTHDDVSVALDHHERITSYAKRGVDDDEYYAAIDAVIEGEPTITIDDGGDLVFRMHEKYPELIDSVLGGCEETTTGVHRLEAMDRDGALRYPMIAVNDTPMKRLFDNVHGTGESALSSISMTTNMAWAGATVVVAGFGYCGSGVARKAAGQDARVIVTEVEPRRALEAHMSGFEVLPMVEAAAKGDVFITTTGNANVLTREHFERMTDGAVLANAGHFNVEIALDELAELAVDRRHVREGIEQFELSDGRSINVLADGRLVNLATPVSLGHPIEVMDQSFGVQAVCVRDLIEHAERYTPGVHQVDDTLDRAVAEIKLAAEGVRYDALTDAQESYLDTWDHGT